MLKLTADNYYSPEADREYMSCSQYQDFLSCEAAAMAKLYGLYTPKKSEALLVGNYFHTALESDEAHEAFCEEHFDDIFKYKIDKHGELIVLGKYAPFKKADEMLSVMLSDPVISSLVSMPGDNEVIMTGIISGVPWKIRLDKYDRDSRTIIDWKTAASLTKLSYNPEIEEQECFIESMGYMMRAAIYTEIERQNTGADTDAKFIIAAVSKEDPPDKGAYLLNHRQRYDLELERVKEHLSRIVALRRGLRKPRRCGACEYCRKTKKLSKIVPYYTLKPMFREEREDEYDERFAAYMEEAQKEDIHG